MNADITALLAAIDSGAITVSEAPTAIRQHGGLVFILCFLAL
jgi:hypothetical protein